MIQKRILFLSLLFFNVVTAQDVSSIEEAFKVLEISPNSSANTVKQAFNKLILKYHPDKHLEASPEELKEFEHLTARIMSAYEFIRENSAIFKSTRKPKPTTQEARYTYGELAEEGTLMHAVQTGNVPVVQELLKAGEPANDIDENGWTPLHHAAYLGQEYITRLLIQYGALLNTPTQKYKWSPLHLAAVALKPETVEVLLKAGARMNTKDEEGQTPLIATINSPRIDKDSPEFKQVVELLLKNKANPNIQDLAGRTALHYAAQKGFFDIVKLLITSGADANIQDKERKKPIRLAKTREIRNYLKPHTRKWWEFWKSWFPGSSDSAQEGQLKTEL